MSRCAALALALLFIAACSSDADVPVAREIVSDIPWEAPETARYRLLQGDDVRGTGELTLVTRGEVLVLNQIYEIPGEEIRDHVAVEADPETLRPAVVRRVIDGPEGERECNATYEDDAVVVDQRSDEGERRDRLDAPAIAYDTWTDLFLWRTLPFAEGFEVKYADVLSCSLAKPDVLSVVLKVEGRETVEVAAGTFETWRLEVRSGGRTQTAWYADDAARTLVRYDNGDLVFELESAE